MLFHLFFLTVFLFLGCAVKRTINSWLSAISVNSFINCYPVYILCNLHLLSSFLYSFRNGLNLKTFNVGFVWFGLFVCLFCLVLSRTVMKGKSEEDIRRRFRTWEFFCLRENSKMLLSDYMLLLAAVPGTCFQLLLRRQTNSMVKRVWTNIGVHEALMNLEVAIIPDLIDRKDWACISTW